MVNPEDAAADRGESSVPAPELDLAVVEANVQRLQTAIDSWQRNQTTKNRPGSSMANYLVTEAGQIIPSSSVSLPDKDQLVAFGFSFISEAAEPSIHPVIDETSLRFYPDVRATPRIRAVALATIRAYNAEASFKPTGEGIEASTSHE